MGDINADRLSPRLSNVPRCSRMSASGELTSLLFSSRLMNFQWQLWNFVSSFDLVIFPSETKNLAMFSISWIPFYSFYLHAKQI